MADTTSITDLPENITMSVHPAPSLPLPSAASPTGGNPGQPPMPPIDPTIINQLVTGLQQATATGATRLRSSDIPMENLALAADPTVQQHHIPHHVKFQGPTPHHNQSPYQEHDQDYPNYIQEEDNMDDILLRNTKRTAYQNQIEQWLDELQLPLMVAILFFLFQLPIVKKMFHEYLPFLFYLDGNMNVNGYILVSLFFGTVYYVLAKILN